MARTFNEMTRDIDVFDDAIRQSWQQLNTLPPSAPEREVFCRRLARLHEELGELIRDMNVARYA